MFQNVLEGGAKKQYVTPELLKKHGLNPGDTFWGIVGQDNRKKIIHFGGYYNKNDKKPEPDYGNTTIKYRSKFKNLDDIVIDGFRAYDCSSGGYGMKKYGTGSGCDPVYFISKTPPVSVKRSRSRSRSPCRADQILNPETGRCVLRTGAIGKKILKGM